MDDKVPKVEEPKEEPKSIKQEGVDVDVEQELEQYKEKVDNIDSQLFKFWAETCEKYDGLKYKSDKYNDKKEINYNQDPDKFFTHTETITVFT